MFLEIKWIIKNDNRGKKKTTETIHQKVIPITKICIHKNKAPVYAK